MIRPVLARARDEEGGWTLAELLVGSLLALFVAALGLAMVSFAVRAQPVATERAGQIQQARAMVERVSRELRQGEQVLEASSSGLTIVTYVDSAGCGGAPAQTALLCRVSYGCTTTACTRTERNPDGTGTAATKQVVSGILGPNVFTFSPDSADPTYVGVRLSFPANDGDEGVTVQDGVALRNYFEGDPE